MNADIGSSSSGTLKPPASLALISSFFDLNWGATLVSCCEMLVVGAVVLPLRTLAFLSCALEDSLRRSMPFRLKLPKSMKTPAPAVDWIRSARSSRSPTASMKSAVDCGMNPKSAARSSSV